MLVFLILSKRFPTRDFPSDSDGEESAYNVGDLGSIPGSRRFPGEGNSNPLQHACLENPMGGEVWWVPKESDTTERLTHTFPPEADVAVFTLPCRLKRKEVENCFVERTGLFFSNRC